MIIPKKIENLIARRERLAEQLNSVCYELDNWLDSHEVVAEDFDTRGGVEIYVNPYASGSRIRKAILDR